MTEPRETRWWRVARAEDVPEGGVLGVEIERFPVALFKMDGEIHALEDVCTHAGAKISEGPVAEGKVTCPWHDAVFDIQTGAPCGGPAFSPAEVYSVRVTDGDVWVALPS